MSAELLCSLTLNVEQKPVQDLTLRPIKACGGASENLLPEVEKTLEATDEWYYFQIALRDLIPRSITRKYQSLVDLLICEFHREWLRTCHLFYSKKGPPLRVMMSEKEAQWLSEDVMLALLKARIFHERGRARQWKSYHFQVMREIKHREYIAL